METKEEEVFELCEENQMAHHIGYQLKIIDRMFRRSMEAMMRKNGVEGDARLKRVCLTDKGRACKHKMKEGREKMEEKVRKGLTEEEIEMFLNVLRKMQENLMDI